MCEENQEFVKFNWPAIAGAVLLFVALVVLSWFGYIPGY